MQQQTINPFWIKPQPQVKWILIRNWAVYQWEDSWDDVITLAMVQISDMFQALHVLHRGHIR